MRVAASNDGLVWDKITSCESIRLKRSRGRQKTGSEFLLKMIYLLAVCVFSTLCMVGVIWFVQIVHYPLMSLVGAAESAAYAAANQRLTTWVVGPLMLVEAASNMALAFLPIPAEVARVFRAGTGLLFVN